MEHGAQTGNNRYDYRYINTYVYVCIISWNNIHVSQHGMMHYVLYSIYYIVTCVYVFQIGQFFGQSPFTSLAAGGHHGQNVHLVAGDQLGNLSFLNWKQ